MIYDPNKISDAARINSVVLDIRTRYLNTLPVSRSKPNIKFLVTCLSIETCKQYLDQVFDLPWVPWKEFDGLTIRQLSYIIGCRDSTVQQHHYDVKDDSEKVSYNDLRPLAEKTIPQHIYHGCPDSLQFSNGTIFDSFGRTYWLLNARAIAYIVVALSSYGKACDVLINKLYDSICKDEEWIIPVPTVASSKPLTDHYEGAVQEIVGVLTDPKPEPKPAPIALPSPLESAVLQFLNTLKPGTKIQIVIPG